MSVKKTITEKRGRWGRRKSDFIIRYMLATSLAAHIVVAVSIIMGCNNAYVDSIPLPPELPYASIMQNGETDGGVGAAFSSYGFVLEWKREPGILYPDADKEEKNMLKH